MRSGKFGYGVDEALILALVFILGLVTLGFWKVYDTWGSVAFWAVVTAPLSFMILFTIFDWCYGNYHYYKQKWSKSNA